MPEKKYSIVKRTIRPRDMETIDEVTIIRECTKEESESYLKSFTEVIRSCSDRHLHDSQKNYVTFSTSLLKYIYEAKELS